MQSKEGPASLCVFETWTRRQDRHSESIQWLLLFPYVVDLQDFNLALCKERFDTVQQDHGMMGTDD